MKVIKTFESYSSGVLIIVDVQKSYSEYFNDVYLAKLKKYCENFPIVYQIFDNHVDGKNVDKDYLYDKDPEVPVHDDVYYFPNQKELIEKRYNYNVNIDFYKKVIDKNTYKIIKDKEVNKKLKKGDKFLTKENTLLVYIGNNHKWIHLPKKLTDLLKSLKGKEVTIVGGASGECIEDIFVSAESLGVNIKYDYNYVYGTTYCPSC